MKSEARQIVGRLGPSGELKVEDVPRFVRELASELADLVRLTGAAFAAILEARLSRPYAPPPQVTAPAATMAVPAPNDKVALTVNEVAVMFGVAESTVRLWIGRRDIAVIRLGRSVRIPKAEINRVISENTVPVRR